MILYPILLIVLNLFGQDTAVFSSVIRPAYPVAQLFPGDGVSIYWKSGDGGPVVVVDADRLTDTVQTPLDSITIEAGYGITIFESDGIITFSIDTTETAGSYVSGISIPPAEGNRMNWMFDGQRWSSSYDDLKICLHYFIGPDGDESLWVQRFDMTENDFSELADFVSDSLILARCCGMVSEDSGRTWKYDDFHLVFADSAGRFSSSEPARIDLARDRITSFFQQKRQRK